MAKLQHDLIENIIVPYKSHRHPFGDFLCGLITELLKVNDQVVHGIHLPKLAKIKTITGSVVAKGQPDEEFPNIAGLDEILVEIDGSTQQPSHQKDDARPVEDEEEERYNVFDSFIVGLLVAAFEGVLKRRKELLKEMPGEVIKRLCHCLIMSLQYQDRAVEEYYTVAKGSPSGDNGARGGERDDEGKAEAGKFGQATQEEGSSHLISVRSTNDELYREACLRFLSQVCFENCSYVPDESIASVYGYVSKLAFLHETEDAQKLQATTFKGNNAMFYKTLRAAFNCVANLLVQPDGGNVGGQAVGGGQASHGDRGEQAAASFIRRNNAAIFASLRKEFEYLMGKLQTYHRSKRFISQMTTVVRALQCSLNYNSGHAGKKAPIKEKATQGGADTAVGAASSGSGRPALTSSASKRTKFGIGGAA